VTTAASPVKWACGFCDPCNKYLYESRRVAKKACRLHRDAHMNPYECPIEPQMFHIGHLAEPVIQGLIDRGELYGTYQKREAA
jgi:hypothetical protein